jgi:hypothetical protein
MKIGIPVKCQNGHKATWFIEFRGLDTVHLGVPSEGKCDCPKHEIGQGYFADGAPFVVGQADAVVPADQRSQVVADVLSALTCCSDDLPDAKTKQQKAMWAIDAKAAMLNAFRLINEQFVENEQLRKDAERYRWLRSKHNDGAEFLAVCGEDDVIIENLMGVDGLDLDAAIDAAMARDTVKVTEELIK